jgi:hypothetical protein
MRRTFAILLLASLAACTPSRRDDTALITPSPPQRAATIQVSAQESAPSPAAPTIIASRTAKPPTPVPPSQLFPLITFDRADSAIIIDCESIAHAPADRSRIVFLEVLACNPNTREHESLLITRARPSHLHAALLLLGIQPGSPGRWEWINQDLRTIAPTGPFLRVDVRWTSEGTTRTAPIADWVIHATTESTLAKPTTAHPAPAFLFAGSQVITLRSPRPAPASSAEPMLPAGSEQYAADLSGTLVGLTAFGDEPIAWSAMYSPEAAVEEPRWIARPGVVPPVGTAVQLIIRPLRPE